LASISLRTLDEPDAELETELPTVEGTILLADFWLRTLVFRNTETLSSGPTSTETHGSAIRRLRTTRKTPPGLEERWSGAISRSIDRLRASSGPSFRPIRRLRSSPGPSLRPTRRLRSSPGPSLRPTRRLRSSPGPSLRPTRRLRSSPGPSLRPTRRPRASSDPWSGPVRWPGSGCGPASCSLDRAGSSA
jgi:hypothetical protein